MEQFSLIFAERLEWKLFKTWSYFRTVCLCNFCARKIRNLGTLFEVIRSAIGSESAVSQTLSKQTIHLCIKTAVPNSIRQQSLSQECRVDSSVSEKACRKSLRSAVGSGQKWSWEELQVKIVIVRRIPRYQEPVHCVHAGHAQMNIPDLIDGSITWQSTLPCCAN